MHKLALTRYVRRQVLHGTSRLSWLKGCVVLAGTLLLGACSSDQAGAAAQGSSARPPLYFDVKGLLNAQVQQLAARHAAVTKRVSLRGSAAETATVPSVKWADELQIFFQADINKAALRGAYRVDSTLADGGVSQRRYTLRPGYKNAAVEQLLVQSVGGQPVEIRANITQNNPLFAATKQLRLRLQNGKLAEYGVSGTQKLILFDTLRYNTTATVQ
jgi:hypothetical protein